MTLDAGEVTALLKQVSQGREHLIDDIVPLVYKEMHALAERQLRRERADHTLNATALVNEAYLRLVHQEGVNWQDRAHFFAIAAMSMRRVLLNYARARRAGKRGGGEAVVTFCDELYNGEMRAQQIIDLDEALTRLSEMDDRQARVVECKFFGGLKYEEIAQLLKVSVPTVRRDWRIAKAWLAAELSAD